MKEAILPFRKFNKNWYNAMAGAALLGNAEIAGGMYVFGTVGADYTAGIEVVPGDTGTGFRPESGGRCQSPIGFEIPSSPPFAAVDENRFHTTGRRAFCPFAHRSRPGGLPGRM